MSSAAASSGSSSSSANTTSAAASLVIESSGQLPWLWGCFFVFGNLFAAFWLARAFLNAHPDVAVQVSRVLGRIRSSKRGNKNAHSSSSSSSSGGGGGGAAAAAANGAGSPRQHHHVRQPQALCVEQSAELVPHAPAPAVAGGSSGSGSGTCSSASSVSEMQRVALDWRNMCYSVKAATGSKTIVKGIYGTARPGELHGLMGPSGAGKSTFMDLLTMRTSGGSNRTAKKAAAVAAAAAAADGTRSVLVALPHGHSINSSDGGAAGPAAQPPTGVSGLLLANGVPISRKAFMSISAYVPQHDNLVPTMTAEESVRFYASIIMPDLPVEQRRSKITRVLAMMGLSHATDTLVGGTLPGGIMLRGMSGGERKRLAIACGVVAGPSLVFLDEPTSGLDSFAALNVVLFLKTMATQHGATLLASLHQPRAAIWSQLDQVTLLASGRLMYTGPTPDLVPWFSSLGYCYEPETHGMASDWALDLVSLGFTKHAHGGADGDSGSNLGGGAGAARRSAMTSRPELDEAADRFLQRLRSSRPGWFGQLGLVADATAAGTAAAYAAPGRQQQGELELQQLAPLMPAAGAAAAAAAAAPAPAPVVLSSLKSIVAARDSSSSPASSSPAANATMLVADDGFEADPKQDAKQHAQDAQQSQHEAASDKPVPEPRHSGAVSSWHKYRALLWREALTTTRNPADVGGRMMTFTYVSFMSGLVAWNLPGGADSMADRLGVCYAVLSFYLLMPFVFMSLFTSDKRFFVQDMAARLYHPAQYFFSKVTITLPFNVIVAIVFHMVYYGMVGMRPGAVYMVQSCVVSVFTGIASMQAIYFCAIAASSQDLAFVYAIAWTALNLLVNPYMALFSGYSLGWGFSWLRFLSPCSFAWQALVQIEFGGRGFDCNRGSGVRAINLFPELLPRTSSFNFIRSNLANLGPRSNNGTCIASGDAIVDMYTSGLPLGATVAILAGYFVVFLALTYAVVWRSSRAKGRA